MASRITNTFAEALDKMMQNLAQMKLLPDCDIELVSAMEEAIMGWYHQPIDNAQQNGDTSVQSSPADIPPGAMPPGGPGQPPAGGVGASQIAGQGGRGMPAGNAPPNADELRRIMAGPQ